MPCKKTTQSKRFNQGATPFWISQKPPRTSRLRSRRIPQPLLLAFGSPRWLGPALAPEGNKLVLLLCMHCTCINKLVYPSEMTECHELCSLKMSPINFMGDIFRHSFLCLIVYWQSVKKASSFWVSFKNDRPTWNSPHWGKKMWGIHWWLCTRFKSHP